MDLVLMLILSRDLKLKVKDLNPFFTDRSGSRIRAYNHNLYPVPNKKKLEIQTKRVFRSKLNILIRIRTAQTLAGYATWFFKIYSSSEHAAHVGRKT